MVAVLHNMKARNLFGETVNTNSNKGAVINPEAPDPHTAGRILAILGMLVGTYDRDEVLNATPGKRIRCRPGTEDRCVSDRVRAVADAKFVACVSHSSWRQHKLLPPECGVVRRIKGLTGRARGGLNERGGRRPRWGAIMLHWATLAGVECDSAQESAHVRLAPFSRALKGFESGLGNDGAISGPCGCMHVELCRQRCVFLQPARVLIMRARYERASRTATGTCHKSESHTLVTRDT